MDIQTIKNNARIEYLQYQISVLKEQIKRCLDDNYIYIIKDYVNDYNILQEWLSDMIKEQNQEQE